MSDDRLDHIVEVLDRMDRRDRWRTIGSTVRGILGIVPLLIFLGSLWYIYVNGEELLQKIAGEAAKQAASYTQDSSEFMKQVQNMMKK